jgi:hypothetical protein
MKRTFTLLTALLLFSLGKSFSQTCVSLDCAAAHTGMVTNTTALTDQPGNDIGGACFASPPATYRQVFWEFFFSTGGNFAQTFTPTQGDGLDLDWSFLSIGTTAPSVVCPVTGAQAPGGWGVLDCSNANTANVATGPGTTDGSGTHIIPTIAGHYYAIAIVVSQSINSQFDIGTPTLDVGGGPVALTSANCPSVILPVKLSSFTSSVNNCVVNLNWTALSESDFKDYEVQYSNDGASFHTIADIAASNPNTNENYSYQHTNPQQGKLFYRLKMVDLDGHVEYSKTIAMKLDCSKAQLLVYPNPVIDILNVNITNLQGVMTAKLFDNNGKLIYTGKMMSGSNTINMSTCPKGMYLLQLIGNDGVQNMKIAK